MLAYLRVVLSISQMPPSLIISVLAAGTLLSSLADQVEQSPATESLHIAVALMIAHRLEDHQHIPGVLKRLDIVLQGSIECRLQLWKVKEASLTEHAVQQPFINAHSIREVL